MTSKTTQLALLNSQISVVGTNFFAPVDSSIIGNLLLKYDQIKGYINNLSDTMISPAHQIAIEYFLDAAKQDERGYIAINVEKLMNKDHAIAVLNAEYWGKALAETDVYEYMPAKRRDEWRDSIKDFTAPLFDENTVYNTLRELLLMRDQFLAERVDGIFNALSGEHVTNSPQGFNKKMIMYACGYSQIGYLSDLRSTIAKFMNRSVPGEQSTTKIVEHLHKNSGKWAQIDGGAFRMKVYMKGTAHIEVHPDIAWRLNEILAFLHPQAIPSEFRKRPEKKYKEFVFTQNMISPAVLATLNGLEQGHTVIPKEERVWNGPNFYWHKNTVEISEHVDNKYDRRDKHVVAKAVEIIKACGGVPFEGSSKIWQFDYNFLDIIGEICSLGYIPDHQAHQYYPTPESIAEYAVELADIEDHHTCLEPSAGQGGIAKYMPTRTQLVEISNIHCKILETTFDNVIESDFVKYAANCGKLYDRIVMNPPFSQGRAEQHLTIAASLIDTDGVLVAILPEGMRKKKEIKGFNYEWSEMIDNGFDGTGISVFVLKMTRKEFA